MGNGAKYTLEMALLVPFLLAFSGSIIKSFDAATHCTRPDKEKPVTFIDMLYNRDNFPLPQIGAGRIHSIDDAEDEIPDHLHRQMEILRAIEGSEGSADAIRRRLGFHMPKALFIADVGELAERGLVCIKRTGQNALYSPTRELESAR